MMGIIFFLLQLFVVVCWFFKDRKNVLKVTVPLMLLCCYLDIWTISATEKSESEMLLCGIFAAVFLILMSIDIGRKIKAHRSK